MPVPLHPPQPRHGNLPLAAAGQLILLLLVALAMLVPLLWLVST